MKPPKVGIRNVGPVQPNPAFQVAWTGTDASGIASYDVQVSVNGGSWYSWLSKTTRGSAIYAALDGRGYAFRVRARDTRGNTSHGPRHEVAVVAEARERWLRARPGRRPVHAEEPSTTSSKVGELNSGDVWRSQAVRRPPVATLAPRDRTAAGVGGRRSVQRDVWIATRKDTTKFVSAAPAPNTATVRAMIGKLGIGHAGIAATANTASGLASRAFSPDGDGYKDTLRLSWVNGRDLDALELRLIDPDGTVAGVVPLSAGRLTAGAHTFAWDGHAGGSRLPNGLYLLALVGSASGTIYSNPSQTLIRAAQLDLHGIRIDTTSPTLSTSASPSAISPNGDGSTNSTELKWSCHRTTDRGRQDPQGLHGRPIVGRDREELGCDHLDRQERRGLARR